MFVPVEPVPICDADVDRDEDEPVEVRELDEPDVLVRLLLELPLLDPNCAQA